MLRLLALAALTTAVLGGAADAGAQARAGASAKAAVPGTFVVRGAPLARARGATAGRRISVFARPQAVAVEGCRTRSARVRLRRGRASVAVVARCPAVRRTLRVRGVVTGSVLRGRLGTRRFKARLKAPPGRLLRGRRRARALGAVRDTDSLQRHEEPAVFETRRGRVAPTEIVLRLSRRATVGQVNTALASVGGRIAGSVAGSRRLAVSIPDPGSLDKLDALLSALGRRQGIDRAERAMLAETQELPPGFSAPLAAATGEELSHLLAMRMPAAWNARAAIRLADRPTLVVADTFGNGPLSAQVDADYDQSALLTGKLPLISPGSRGHGYHVVGIAAANFASNGSRAGRVTGVFPARAKLTLIDVVGLTLEGAGQRVLQAVRQQPGRVVVNTSLGHNPSTDDASARREGSDWAESVRTSGYVDRMVHAASAGNAAIEATRNSPWVAAALRADLTTVEGVAAQPLANTLAVESLADTGAAEFQPGCLGLTSNRRGNLAAVGVNVFSNLLGSAAGNRTGTSMASPQAAGLAEYIWSVAPDLTARQVVAAMIATAAPPLPVAPGGCLASDLPSAPRLDAYAALLSLDRPDALTRTGAPVRHAILDRDGNGSFDQADLQSHLAALGAAGALRDWSRSDLNGDGFTGGPGVLPFDLDLSGSARAGAPLLNIAAQTIEGVSMPFDERNVSDIQALCFYAYSGLYGGSPEARRSVMDPTRRCGVPEQAEPGGNCTATTAFGLAATITGTDGDDEITGTAGDDVIIAGAGDDRISGRQGNDRICGGPGNDDLRGGSGLTDTDDEDGFGPDPPIDSGDDLLDGGPDIDRVAGTGGNDRVFGGAGDSDSVLGNAGSDHMEGGDGDNDVCSRAEQPRHGADTYGPGCEFIND